MEEQASQNNIEENAVVIKPHSPVQLPDSPSAMSVGDARSSESSSPEPPAAREAKFVVEQLEKVLKEGELPKYTIVSIKTLDGHKYRVHRTFHDFQFLAQQLFHSGQCLAGYIIPPFPAETPQNPDPLVEANTRQLPGYGKFVSDEFQLYHWLRLVLAHPVFGHSGLIEPFLCEKSLPPPGKIKKHMGIIKSIQETIDSRKYAHKDCDSFFQNERDWSLKVYDLMQQSTVAFNSTVNARHSLSQVLAHLSAALSLPVGDNRGINKLALKINQAFSKTLDGYREYVEAETINGASTLGATLHLWTRYIEAEHEMLKQRTCLLVDYESANRALDRAKHTRRTEVRL